jgi:periplasmic divalent cation tolerance protein
MSSSPDVVLVYMTAPSEAVALSLARSAVEARLAACGNLIPQVRSVYRWQGEVCDDPEVLVLFKTTAAGLDALRLHLVAAHPYDCPEFIAVPVVHGHIPYLDWVRENVG